MLSEDLVIVLVLVLVIDGNREFDYDYEDELVLLPYLNFFDRINRINRILPSAKANKIRTFVLQR